MPKVLKWLFGVEEKNFSSVRTKAWMECVRQIKIKCKLVIREFHDKSDMMFVLSCHRYIFIIVVKYRLFLYRNQKFLECLRTMITISLEISDNVFKTPSDTLNLLRLISFSNYFQLCVIVCKNSYKHKWLQP